MVSKFECCCSKFVVVTTFCLDEPSIVPYSPISFNRILIEKNIENLLTSLVFKISAVDRGTKVSIDSFFPKT